MIRKMFRFRFLGILGFIVVIAVFSVAAMLLWNWLMPAIFGLSVLSYWQALALVALCRILFGGIGPDLRGHGGPWGPGGRHMFHGNKLREKWMNMSEDERKEFIDKEHDFRDFFRDRFSTNEGDKRV